MTDIAKRFIENPLISPRDLKPSASGLHIACLLNPGVFTYLGKTWLIIRVAERPLQREVYISLPIQTTEGKIQIQEIKLDDPDLIATDTRIVRYKGLDYLTTLSHLRLLCSDDNVHFYEVEEYPALYGQGVLETFGIEDCRVSLLDSMYYLTYTAVSENGVGVGLRTTSDWKRFVHHGMIMPPQNKDCAIFTERITGLCYAFHRPSSLELGGNYIWLASSPDGIHWGNHQCIIRTRPQMWDSVRVGAGAAPIRTDEGWLAIYHGANAQHQYCLGAFLLDLEDPSVVIGRTKEPIMIPTASYELIGFFGEVVFTNGHILNGDEITVYYGAADEFICAAKFSVTEILSQLQTVQG
ncbi:glycosidase [Chitinophaga agrisoli]|uniref:Glycosidase n=1 Tax=Chitinophaga agrisoli TaxID=2607653 RepID=A0A5B2VIC0_9BACT|nr:glycoside hydrolase family 130 protein [Chitinophaga agrisoli]KAA2238378.1 glycosidase [Chitinophaga agrisoli]